MAQIGITQSTITASIAPVGVSVAVVDLTGQTAAIAATNFANTGSGLVSGVYAVWGYLVLTASGVSGTISVTIGYTDDTGSPNSQTTPTTLVSAGGDEIAVLIPMFAAANSAISYKVNFGSVVGSPAYAMHLRLVAIPSIVASGAGGSGANASRLQSVNISGTGPLGQQVLRYIGANSDWEPSNDEAFIPCSRWKTLVMANGQSTTLGAFGDVVTTTGGSPAGFGPTAARNAIVSTGAASGSNYGFSGLANFRGDHNFAAMFACCMTNNSIVSQRTWVGLTDQTIATMLASANPAGNYAAFRFDTSASDAVFQCITKDASTQNIVSSGVAPVTGTSARFAIVYDNVNSKVQFYINSVLVATSSAHLPTNTANLLFVMGGVSSSGSGAVNIETVVIEQDL